MDIPQDVAGAWGIPSGMGRHRHLPNDASLFSASLPVLPHGKRIKTMSLNDHLCYAYVMLYLLLTYKF